MHHTRHFNDIDLQGSLAPFEIKAFGCCDCAGGGGGGGGSAAIHLPDIQPLLRMDDKGSTWVETKIGARLRRAKDGVVAG